MREIDYDNYTLEELEPILTKELVGRTVLCKNGAYYKVVFVEYCTWEEDGSYYDDDGDYIEEYYEEEEIYIDLKSLGGTKYAFTKRVDWNYGDFFDTFKLLSNVMETE